MLQLKKLEWLTNAPAFGACSQQLVGSIKDRLETADLLKTTLVGGVFLTLFEPDPEAAHYGIKGLLALHDADELAEPLSAIDVIVLERIRTEVGLFAIGSGCAASATAAEKSFWEHMWSWLGG